MLLIGIDEAGYGPLIGPLCHGYAAFRIENHYHPDPPCLWKLLHPAVSRDGSSGIAVSDSKALYSPQTGFAALERGVRACMECIDAECSNGQFNLRALLPESDFADVLSDHWAADDVAFEPAMPESDHCGALKNALAQRGVTILALGARAMSARSYNSNLKRANKSDVNWSVAANQLRALAQLARPGEALVALIDRQGGRKFYAPLLCEMFCCALAHTEFEDARSSIYRLDTPERTIRVGFFVDGDLQHFPVALASMCAKLTRELVMLRINAYFKKHLPELKGTAGYYKDGRRFLRETKELRRALKIEDAHFVRGR